MDEHSIFVAALERDSQQDREELLREVCANDDALRRRVARLLEVHEAAAGFLEEPVLPNRDDEEVSEKSGSTIGPYKLLEQIGEGGMGVVFAAQQFEPVKRKVAIKIIKPGMDTRQVIARFDAERQALALMEHPNIARVLDAGTTDSERPYFVMELARGVPITDYCDQERLTTEERLALFLSTCDAVRHAHQKGIIHRDLKPSNILVTLHDGQPVVKMIDFGVAKATNGRLTERTLFTNLWQVIGTPMYMSPEQAEMTGMDVDTRSDVYSLGVLLYELLTGSTPFQRDRFRQAGYDEIRRIIREEEPPRPSSRVSTVDAAITTIFEHRSTDPRRLKQSLQGELDWIVLKAIDKVRSRRYQSAAELSGDIKRYLANQPVEACPPSILYQFKKLVARHRAAVASISLILTLLFVGAAVSTWLAVRAVRAERIAKEAQRTAETEAAIAIAINDFLTNDLLRQASPYAEPDRDVKLRDVIDRASQRIEGHFKDQPLVEAAIRMNLGTSYFHLGEYDAAARHFDSAFTLRSGELGGEAAETLQAVFYQARTTLQLEGTKVAAPLFDRVLRLQQTNVGPEHHDTLLSMDWLAYCYVLMGRYDEAEPLLTRAAEAFERLLGPEHPDTLDCLDGLAILYRHQNRFELAEPLTQRVLQTRQRSLGEDHPQFLESLSNLAALYNKMGQLDRAIAVYKRAREHHQEVFGERHPFTLLVIRDIAAVLRNQKRYDEAEQLYLTVLDGEATALGQDDERTLRTMRTLASMYESQSQYAEAEHLCAQVLESRRRVLGNNHEFTVNALRRLAAVYAAQDRLNDAKQLYQEVVEIQARVHGKEDPQTLIAMMELAGRLQGLKRYTDSQAIVEQVLECRERLFGNKHRETLKSRMRLAFLHKLLGRFEEAEQLFLQAHEESKTVLGHEHTETLRAANQLAYLWQAQGRHEEAESLCRETLEGRRRVLGDEHRDTALSMATLAMILSNQQRFDEAATLLEQALEVRKRVFGEGNPQTRDAERRLATARRAIATVAASE